MSGPAPTWDTAATLAGGLCAADRRALLLLARLPLLPEKTMERLAGLAGGASIYRTLADLSQRELVDRIQGPVAMGRPPRLYYLTSLGLAVVAGREQVDVRELARRNRLRGPDLLKLAAGLPHLQALYDLLGGIAASQPGPPDLLAWERPWRRRYQRPTAKAPVPVALPAYAALSWGRDAGAYLLLADISDLPLRLYRSMLDHLLLLQGIRNARFPHLVVGTWSTARAGAWHDLLEEARRARSETPLAARVTTWDAIDAGRIEVPVARSVGNTSQLIHRVTIRRTQSRRRGSVPDLVGGTFHRAPTPGAIPPFGCGLDLPPDDRAFLDAVGQHPFLPSADLQVVLGTEITETWERRNRLFQVGLVRLLASPEVEPEVAARELIELTPDGLRIAAAQHGLSLGMAVRHLGLVGGGPNHPVGVRANLVRNLAHTLGTDRVFIRMLQVAASARLVLNADDAMIAWRSAAACRWGYVRPDGYGLYRCGGKGHGFFLEYDRGTASYPRYLQKFDAYYSYWTSGAFHRDYVGFPTVLVVTERYRREAGILRAARTAAFGREPAFPLLVTSTWRIASHPAGPLGPVWRGPADDPEDFHPWF